MKIAEAFVELRIDSRKAQAEARTEGRAVAQSMSSQFVQYFTAAVVVNELRKVKDAASNLQQAIGGTEKVFGQAAATIDAFAADSVDKVGLSERAFRELTTQIGGLLSGLGLAQDEAAKTSILLTQTGADLAAAYGGSPQEAVLALGAALRGEYDPLERFGVSLRVSAVNLKAVEMGLAENKNAVDDNARAQATLALITERSANTLGAFADEADTAAVKEAKLAGQLEDQRATIGEALLPIYTRVIDLLATMGDGFAKLPAPAQTAIVALLGIAAVAGPINNLIGSMTGLATSIKAVQISSSTSAVLLRTLGAAAVVAGTGYVSFAAAAKGLEGDTDWLYEKVPWYLQGFQELGRLSFELAGGTKSASAEWQGYASEAEAAYGTMTTGIYTMGQLTEKLDESSLSLQARNLIMTAFSEALDAQAEAEANLAEAQAEQADAARDAADANDEFRFALDDGRGSVAGLDTGLQTLGEALTDAADKSEFVGQALDVQVEATERAQQAAEDLRDAVNDSFSGAKSSIFSFTDESMEDLDTWQQSILDNAQAMYDWQNNLVTVAKETSPQFAAFLAEMGLAGAGLVEDMVGNGAELEESFNAWKLASGVAGRDMAAEFAVVAPEFRKILEDLPAGVSAEWDAIRSEFSGEGSEIGSQLAAGMAAGMTAGSESVFSAARFMVQRAVAEARGAAGIASPSRVFAEEVGQPIAEGVAQGIIDDGTKIADALENQILDAKDAAVAAAQELVDAMNDTLDGVWDGIDLGRRLDRDRESVSDAQTKLDETRAALRAKDGNTTENQEKVSDAEQALRDANLALFKDLLENNPNALQTTEGYNAAVAAGLTIEQRNALAGAQSGVSNAQGGLAATISARDAAAAPLLAAIEALRQAIAGPEGTSIGGGEFVINLNGFANEESIQLLIQAIEEIRRREQGAG